MSTAVHRFADFEIDPQRREIRDSGAVVPVQPRVFDLVLYLLEHRDRAVGKDELQDALWPGVIVTETALTRAVMKARRALGDDPERQAVIRTVHGHGYQFVAALDAEAPAPMTRDPGPAASTTLAMVLGGVLMAALVAVAALLLWRDAAPADTRIAVLPLADRTGNPELAWVPLGLMSYANRLLSEAGALQTVPARRVMDAAEALPDEPTERELQAARARLGASHLLHGSLLAGPLGFQLNWRMAHAGGTSPPRSLEGSDPARLAQRMVRDALGILPGSGAARPFRTVSEDDFVNEAYARGLALQLQGEVAQARDYFEVAVRQAPGLFWPRYELALTLRDMGELEQAQSELEQLAAHPAASDDPEARVAAWNALGQVYWRRRDHQAAQEAYENALQVAVQARDWSAQSTLHTNLGIITRIMGDMDAARGHLSSALQIHQEHQDRDVGFVYQSLGQVELQSGRPSLAREHYQRARAAFRETGNRRGEAAALNAMARVDHRLAHYPQARDGMSEALAIREALGDHFGQLSSLMALAILQADAGQSDAALRHAEQALALAESAEQQPEIVEALELLARVHLDAGRPGQAREALERLEAIDPEGVNRVERRLVQTRIRAADGDREGARQLLDDLVNADPPAARADALWLRGTLQPEIAAAREDWTQALAIAREHGDQVREARVLLTALQRERDEGDPARSNQYLQVLEDEFPQWPPAREVVSSAP